MNKKGLIFFVVLVSTLLLIGGIIYVPKIKRAMEFKEAMEIENIESSFINMGEFLPTKDIKKADTPFIFPRIDNVKLPGEFIYDGITYNTTKFLDSSYTQGLLWIQNDTILYENYWRGQKEDIQHISWSVAKSYVSALFGITIEEGYIKNIEQTVDEYLPELVGSGYEGVKIKDVLQMSTGVKFDETYSDPNSDISRYWKEFVLGGSQDEFAQTLVNGRPPGTFNHYVSINTHVLGMIIVKATGQSLTKYLEEKIWQPLGCEFPAFWLADGEGMEMALGGLNACLRDYAKIGRLFLNKGNWEGKQIVPEEWVVASTSASEEHLLPGSQNSSRPALGYGYQWWIADGNEGEFFANGVFNQSIYINPTTNTIIVKNSANKNYYDDDNPYTFSLTHIELYRKLAHHVQ